MKVRIAFYFLRKTIVAPQICCRCACNAPYGYDEILSLNKEGHYLYKNTFKFPYCYSCYEELKKRKIFKGKVRAVDVSNVTTKRYGRFLRKTLKYFEFDFKNDKYGQLFKEANRDLLLENVLSELEAKER